MKRLLSILLAAILLLTCIPALAEEDPTDTVFFEALGVTLDLAAIREKCTNSLRLESDGVLSRDPYVALSHVIYYAIPQQMLDQIVSDYKLSSEEDQQAYAQLIQSLAAYAAFIIVSDAPDQAAMIDALGLKVGNGVEVSEVATKDRWHCYFVKLPVDDLLAVYDDPEIIDGEYTEEMARADQEAVRTDVELIQSALMQQLQTGEWVEPVDPSDRLIGQTLELRPPTWTATRSAARTCSRTTRSPWSTCGEPGASTASMRWRSWPSCITAFRRRAAASSAWSLSRSRSSRWRTRPGPS